MLNPALEPPGDLTPSLHSGPGTASQPDVKAEA